MIINNLQHISVSNQWEIMVHPNHPLQPKNPLNKTYILFITCTAAHLPP